jgi:hypothetical protein
LGSITPDNVQATLVIKQQLTGAFKMEDKKSLPTNFTAQETDMLESLRQEMGLSTTDEVIRALVRQAYQRTQILCPSCGGKARTLADGRAECSECMSVLRLAESTLVTLVGRRSQT